LSTIDYYLSSDLMEPAHADEHYTEKLIRLPGSGLFYDRFERSTEELDRKSLGLDDGLLILVPQNPRKFVPKWDYLWAEVCAATGRPIVFVENDTYVTQVSKRRMAKAGVNAIWVPRLKPTEFRKLIELADLIIDPPAWSGGNTTLEAIALGKPVIAFEGEFMRGRHSLAFLKQAGMQQLVAKDPQDYIRLVCDRELQLQAVANANLDGPFQDYEAVRGLDEWIRSVVPV